MAADWATHASHQKKVPGMLKASLIAPGLLACGMAAVTIAERTGQPQHAAAAAAAPAFVSAPAQGNPGSDTRLIADDYLSSNMDDKISLPVSTPRECKPEQGIVSNCTY
jgi:hypothetical protein